MRRRSPKRVRHSSQALNGTMKRAKSVTHDMLLVRPRAMPADVGDEEPVLLLEPTEDVRSLPTEQIATG